MTAPGQDSNLRSPARREPVAARDHVSWLREQGGTYRALAAADKAALFKTAVKEIAFRHGLIPTFMAKWNSDLPGSSGHLHQSLWQSEENVFADGAGGISPLMKQYIAGLTAASVKE